MIISVEISYYPLTGNYSEPINELISILEHSDLNIEPGKMSTIITGSFHDVFSLLEKSMQELFEKYPSVFTLKISNSCPL
ncbi:MAG: YkoF family thiamine/hydroxymethylpyrimidine-binding protein [Salinivirgaceae bacterium]